jgi:hypothetical protein
MEKKNREKGGARSVVALMAARWHGRRGKRGQGGPGFGAAWRKKTGEREGVPGTAGDSSGSRHRHPVSGHGRRRCRAIGEGGGARATRVRVADRWDRAMSGPLDSGWVREGVRGSEAAAASSADKRDQKYSKRFKRIQNNPNLD